MGFAYLLEVHVHPDNPEIADRIARYLRSIQRTHLSVRQVLDPQIQKGSFEVYDPIEAAETVETLVATIYETGDTL